MESERIFRPGFLKKVGPELVFWVGQRAGAAREGPMVPLTDAKLSARRRAPGSGMVRGAGP